ncbi:MAG: thioredoxin family protein [Merismopedia sp. SIO2A8]|nr:thioredoxin family protein [Merismopedia sp. SIO2A8]
MELNGTPVGSYAPDFELPGIDKHVHHLSRYLEKWRGIGVIFISNNCPYVLSYVDRLKKIQSQFHDQNFTLIGINSDKISCSQENCLENMKKFARDKQLNFPYLWDSTQEVAQSFGAQKTLSSFLIDQLGIVFYKGCIDDNSQQPAAVKQPYLQRAIAAMLAGEEASPQSTEVIGSEIEW